MQESQIMGARVLTVETIMLPFLSNLIMRELSNYKNGMLLMEIKDFNLCLEVLEWVVKEVKEIITD